MGGLLAACSLALQAQATPNATQAAPAQSAPAQGGSLHGTVVAGTAGKPGGIPLPGVAVTATNSLTGKKYTTTTDVNGAYAMAIPRNGRYVVRVELAAFAAQTGEVLINAAGENGGKPDQTSDFGLQLASRVEAAEAQQTATAARASTGRGLQSLSLNVGGDADTSDASANAGASTAEVAAPSLGGLGDNASDAVAVSGRSGETNNLANFSEDEIRNRIEDAMANARMSGQLPQGGGDVNVMVSVIGGMMAGGPGGFMVGGGGPRGGGGGARGGGARGGGGGGGFGAFRNFNPAQPHGSLFYQGSNTALNASQWQPNSPGLTHFTPNPAGYSNRFGVSLAGSPYIPGLIQPNTKQFAFLSINGQRNLNPYTSTGRVPTALERMGDFSQSFQRVNGVVTPVTLYDPTTHLPIAGNVITNISPQAKALLALGGTNPYIFPTPNLATSDPTANNYQTVSNAGSNNLQLSLRFNRTLGSAPTGPFGGMGRGGGGQRGQRGQQNQKPTLRQSINSGFNYSHSASDNRNIFLPLGGATQTNGYGLNVGYTIGYGRLSNNASANWNRSFSQGRNYFTDTSLNPTAAAGINVPNQAGSLADPRFYNGVPALSVTNFTGVSNQAPSETISQTISFSDFVSWRHAKHNFRFGVDYRRLHNDSIGGNNPLGRFTFTGFATESSADQASTTAGKSQQATTGSGFADFLLGRPTQTALQAGLNKIYLRENVYDWYALDDFRLLANVTLNYGLRYEYFAPYTEKYNRLVNLDHNADFTSVDPVQPNGVGTYLGNYPRSLVNPDRSMYSPRVAVAWRPKIAKPLTKDMVVRAGYGINYNTGQFATFAKNMAFQQPFAKTQTNTLTTAGCSGITLANGFDCSQVAIQNNFSVNKNYRLGMVQVYNFDIQKTLPLNIVMNVGYNGSHGGNLDIVRAPNHTVSGVTTSDAQAFTYEDSIGASRFNALTVSAQKRMQKGVAMGATYVYGHSIDNASSIGGSGSQVAQNDKRLDLEESNSSFDVRHSLSGNWVLELPFGPNRAFLSKGGFWAGVFDGFSWSGTFSITSGRYFTPAYSSSASQALAGNTYPLRPDRIFSQPIKGAGQLYNFFNQAAFVAPANGFGTASRYSIQGPGTLTVNSALSRTVKLGDTRSLEARASFSNIFNTVQYTSINTTVNSSTYGQVTSAGAMRALQFEARYRF